MTTYAVHRIQYEGKQRPVILQAVNGPCPLIAICNVLFLRGDLTLHAQQTRISFGELSVLIKQYLETKYSKLALSSKNENTIANDLQNLQDALELLPKLERGLDINVMFTACNAFEYTKETALFDLFNIKLLHGWVYDPQDKETKTSVGDWSYNQCVNHISTRDMKEDTKTDEDIAREEDKRQGIERWLQQTAAQLTVCGLSDMHRSVQEYQLCVHFRNNHFATITKRRTYIFSLVTDAGIVQADRRIAWQRIGDIDGDDVFLDSDFRIPGSPRPPKPQQQQQQQQQQQHNKNNMHMTQQQRMQQQRLIELQQQEYRRIQQQQQQQQRGRGQLRQGPKKKKKKDSCVLL